MDLWPSQTLAAKRVIDESDSLVVALPTSSGKTRIAELCILKCLAGKRRVIYVTPLRALSAQVEGTLGRCFKPLGFTVTSVYGASGIGASDVDTMRSADIVVATPEKLDFAIRQDPDAIADVGLIVLDEGHMIGLSEREIRYEILVQRLLRRADADKRRIVCLSAIFTEGAAFDAFTQWIRSDNDGNAIQSNWRPTRQIPATLRWTDSRGWLEYRVAGEKVFIPRFIEEASPKRPRRNPFPQNQAELVVAAIERFSDDGHSVLLYCPLRSSVETAAETFLKMESYGYAKSHLRTEAAIEIKRALSIGEEWLGISHVAIRALRLGIAVHHGQLPRPFLSELEDLLKRQVLSVAISSPTLAQGVDLSFGVLIFKSLWRSGELIKAKEFANVIGRVGRAFVDIDGIYVLPVLELAPGREANRLDEFHRLIRHAKSRELESGLYLLISICLSRLKRKLDLEDNALSDYVLNQQQAIDTMAEGSDENAEQMEIILAELDAGILALVDNLECDDSQIASKLDEALNNSLWKRRLAIKELEERRNQIAMLHGRALHIWKRTNVAQRKGFYSASIGTESGLQIVANRSELESLLESATKAIRTGAVEQLSDDCCKLAKTLFQFYPFQPSMPADWDESTWTAILDAWIKGAALHRVTNSAGIAFVQEAIIYRLVWAIESVRLVLNNLAENTKDGLVINDDRTFVAICLTYGVPKMSAARMLECGMESRLLAVRIAKELNLNFTKRDELIDWLIQYKETEPLTFSEEERTAWQRFVDRNEYSFDLWLHRNDVYEVRLGSGIEVELGKSIRIIPNENGSAELYTPDFEWLGRTKSNVTAERSLIGTTIEQGRVIAKTFGPPKRSKGTSASHNK
ncbi:Helicase, C-terminal:DEAD/DEAH box helicase, N-terminal [Blastopirellula marina DSM 3645]|uniref:Helicase, C-terminal:DEAD/DEAH box helicase, N-terminal n=1 Tax=Blastopirellula marina DSM 3645 TaxID=314230 RepID=A3ZVS9_9BACT|nr:Helicase, C-terminal:DEAD/DEAH box helicase, N-terminal [Blastopirellula marina DSM 3645]